MHAHYSMKMVSREFKVTPRALRFYEEKGLLTPKREKRNRLYSDKDLNRLRFIQRFKAWDFSLDEIADLLESYDENLSQYQDSESLKRRLDSQRASLLSRKERLEKSIRDIQVASTQLESNVLFR